MTRDLETPFASLEGAQEYLALMLEAVTEAQQSVQAEVPVDGDSQPPRRVEALRLVQYKLDKLEQHIKVSRRLLNDLRSLRRLLFEERTQSATLTKERKSA